MEISTILNNIEKSYKDKKIDFKLSDRITITIGIPTSFYVDESNNIVIDYLSNIIGVNGTKTSKRDNERLLNTLSTKQKSVMENYVVENLKEKFDIFEGVPLNKLEIPLFRFPILINSANVFRLNLKSFYDMLYMMSRHVKMTYEGFMDMTFIESDIIIKTCIEEKTKESEQMNSSMN